MKTNKYVLKITALALSVACLSLSLAGCKKETNQKPTPSTSKVTITSATSFGSSDDSAADYVSLLKSFRDNNPNVTVIDNSAKADDHWKSAIREQFEGGREPDVMFFFTAIDAKSIVENNKVVSIDEIRKVYPDYASNILPEAIEDTKEADGKSYAVPLMRFWEGIYYNEDLFKKYNVPPLTDWDSLLNAVEIFSKNNVIPISASFSDVPNYWIEHSILATGGVKDHSANPKSANEVPASWAKGIEAIADLYKRGAFQSDALVTQHELALNEFNKGRAAMIIEGSWADISPEIGKSVRVCPMPTFDNVAADQKGVISGLSMGFYISRKAWNDPVKQKACVDYVEHMTSNDAISTLCRGNAPTADVKVKNDLYPQITADALKMCQENITEMPIDSRVLKASWEYLIQQIPPILRGDEKAFNVMTEFAKYNKG